MLYQCSGVQCEEAFNNFLLKESLDGQNGMSASTTSDLLKQAN